MRIRIVAPLVTPVREPQQGGSQAVVADLAGGLALRGHDVEVVAASGSAIDGARVIEVETGDLTADLVHPGRARSAPSPALRDAYVRAYAIEGPYDVLHNHGFDVPAIELAPPKTVHTLHLPVDAAIVSALEGAETPVVVCVSHTQAAGWPIVHAVVRNGVPVSRIPFGAKGEGHAVFAGRLSPEKGAAEAVEIARLAKRELVVYGDAYDPAYAATVRSEPALPRERLWRELSRASAVLCPVRWDEPFGMVAAEAQAAGTPVIAFARGGLLEVVRDGVTGALVDDIKEAADALRGVERFDRRECRAHAERTLDLERTIDAHERLYEHVMRLP